MNCSILRVPSVNNPGNVGGCCFFAFLPGPDFTTCVGSLFLPIIVIKILEYVVFPRANRICYKKTGYAS